MQAPKAIANMPSVDTVAILRAVLPKEIIILSFKKVKWLCVLRFRNLVLSTSFLFRVYVFRVLAY